MKTSWDFWDTLVSRRVSKPTDVFELVEKISKTSGFTGNRINAEISARRTADEVTIDEIYCNLKYSEEKILELKNLEIAIEKKLAFPIIENVNKLSNDDLIISDMYLSRNILHEITNICGIKVKLDNMIVSSEKGKTKRTGELYKYALKHFNIKQHNGDNLHSDVLQAQKNGIEAKHYTQSQIYTKVESFWADNDLSRRLISGALRAGRLSRKEGYPADEWEIYSQIVAPLIITFCEYIIENSIDRGIKKLYFLARDGQILHKVASKIIKKRNLDIKCIYMYASRQALHPTGFLSIDEAEGWILDGPYPLSLDKISNRTGIEIEKIKSIFKTANNIDAVNKYDIKDIVFLKKLIRHNDFVNELKNLSQQLLFNSEYYLKSIGLIDDLKNNIKIAVIDVGWRCRLQKSIENIAVKLGYNQTQITGFYLGITNSAYKDGNRCLGFLCDEHDDSRPFFPEWISRYGNMFEYFLRADHPQVQKYINYDNGVLFGNQYSQYKYNEIIRKQEAIISTTEHYCSILEFSETPLLSNWERSLIPLKKFLERPTITEARLFSSGMHSGEQFEISEEPLLSKVTLLDAFRVKPINGYGFWLDASFTLAHCRWALDLRRIAGLIIRNFIKQKPPTKKI